MFGASIESALVELRGYAEQMMVDTCRVWAEGEPVWDEATGTYSGGSAVTVYEGKCRLRKPSAAPRDVESGEAPFAVDEYVLSLPVDGSEDVKDGQQVEILTSANDPATVGLLLEVLGGHWQSHATARRLPCRVVVRDA